MSNESLYSMLKKRLTKKELDKLESLVDEYGSLEDVVLMAVRKFVNPDLLTFDEIENCLTKAMKISAYTSAFNTQTPAGDPTAISAQVAREVVSSLNGSDGNQSNNPFREMLLAFQQQLQQQILEEIKSRLSLPLPPRSSHNSNGNSGGNNSTTKRDTDEIFKGDED